MSAKGQLVLRATLDTSKVATGLRGMNALISKENEAAVRTSIRLQGQVTRETIRNNEEQLRSETRLQADKERLRSAEARANSNVAKARKEQLRADTESTKAEIANIKAVSAAEKEQERQEKKRASDQVKRPTSSPFRNAVFSTRLNIGGSSPLVGRTLAAAGMDLKSNAALAVGTGAVVAGAAAPAIDKLKEALMGAVQVAGDFDQGMHNVNSIAHLTEPQLKKLSESVIAVSKDKQISAGPEELAKSLYDIYSSGKEGAEALDILKVASMGAGAGLTQADVSGRVLLATLNSGIRGVEGPSQAMDVLFGIVDKGVITFDQLANSLGEVLPVASQAGVSIQEVGAYIAIATRQGQSGSEAINDLQNLLSKLIKPPKDAKDAFDKLGIAYGATELRAKGLGAKLQEIAEKTHGNADALKVLFPDMQAYRAILSSATNGGKAYRDMLAEMSDKQAISGKTAKALAEQNKSLWAEVDKVKKEFKIIAVEVGPAFLRALHAALEAGKPFLKVIGDLAQKFSELTPEQQKWIMGMGGVGIAVSNFLISTVPLLARLGELKAAYIAVRNSAAAANLAKFAVAGVTGTTLAIGAGAAAIGGIAYTTADSWLTQSNKQMNDTYGGNDHRIEVLKGDRTNLQKQIDSMKAEAAKRSSGGNDNPYMAAMAADPVGVAPLQAKIDKINSELKILGQQEARNRTHGYDHAATSTAMDAAMGGLGLNSSGTPDDTTGGDTGGDNPLAGWEPGAEKKAAAAARKAQRLREAAARKAAAARKKAQKEADALLRQIDAENAKMDSTMSRGSVITFENMLNDIKMHGTEDDSVNLNRARPQAALKQSDHIAREEFNAAKARTDILAKKNPEAAAIAIKAADARIQQEAEKRKKQIEKADEEAMQRIRKTREEEADNVERGKELEKQQNEDWAQFVKDSLEAYQKQRENYRAFLSAEADQLQSAQEQAKLSGKLSTSMQLRQALFDNQTRQITEEYSQAIWNANGDPNAIAAAKKRRDVAQAQARRETDRGLADDILGGTSDQFRGGASDAVSQLFHASANGKGNSLDALTQTFANIGETAGNAFADYAQHKFVDGPMSDWMDKAAAKIAGSGADAGQSILMGANALSTVVSLLSQQNGKKKSGGILGGLLGGAIGFALGGPAGALTGFSAGAQAGQGNFLGAALTVGTAYLGAAKGNNAFNNGKTYSAGFYAEGGMPPPGRMSIVGDRPEMAFTEDGRVTMLGLGGYQEYRPTGRSVVLDNTTSSQLVATAAKISGSGSSEAGPTIIKEGDKHYYGDIYDPLQMEQSKRGRERDRRTTTRIK